MNTIFGIIQKRSQSTENARLIEHLKSKSAYFEIIKGNSDFIIGSLSDTANSQSEVVCHLENLVGISDARIDNKVQLCQRLNLSPNQQAELSDTDLILHCYQRWSAAFLDYLEGDFTLVIWNKESQELFLATDHLGHRQMYYQDSSEHFIFSSQLKILTALVDTPGGFNDTSIIDYFFKIQNPEETFIKNVHLLPGASFLMYHHDKSFQLKKYWVPNDSGKYHFSSDEDWFGCAKELITKAIAKRVGDKTKTGITLSGGLDSSSIACILAGILKERNEPLYAFSSVLPHNHREKDERKFIEYLVKLHPNIIPEFIETSDKGTFSNVDNSFYIDEVIPNAFHYVDQSILLSAKKKGVQNLFTGYGGDFWVSWKGYSVIYQLFMKGKYQKGLHLMSQSARFNNHSLLKSLRMYILPNMPIYKSLKSKLGIGQVKDFFKKDFVNDYTHLLNNKEDDYIKSQLNKINNGNIGRVLATLRTRNQSYGMESSVPFLDKSLFEFFVAAPKTLFIKDGVPRSILRQSMNGVLPDYIRLRRDKLPYAPGFNTRLINDKETMLELINEPDSAFIFERYIDKPSLISQIMKLSPYHSANTSLTLSIVQTINIIITLNSLKKQNYRFE